MKEAEEGVTVLDSGDDASFKELMKSEGARNAIKRRNQRKRKAEQRHRRQAQVTVSIGDLERMPTQADRDEQRHVAESRLDVPDDPILVEKNEQAHVKKIGFREDSEDTHRDDGLYEGNHDGYIGFPSECVSGKGEEGEEQEGQEEVLQQPECFDDDMFQDYNDKNFEVDDHIGFAEDRNEDVGHMGFADDAGGKEEEGEEETEKYQIQCWRCLRPETQEATEHLANIGALTWYQMHADLMKAVRSALKRPHGKILAEQTAQWIIKIWPILDWITHMRQAYSVMIEGWAKRFIHELMSGCLSDAA